MACYVAGNAVPGEEPNPDIVGRPLHCVDTTTDRVEASAVAGASGIGHTAALSVGTSILRLVSTGPGCRTEAHAM